MDLGAYFERIGYPGPARADLATLCGVHRAHATTIPFENLDIQLGRPIDLRLDALERKIVRGGRGGYCFEHNSLLLAALRALGFAPLACEARVFDGGAGPTPRVHMLLVVAVEGGRWLCDVGFGGDTPLEPVPLDGTAVEQGGARYRVAAAPAGLVLQAEMAEGWTDLYLFEPTARHAIDFEVANWYMCTHPESRFVKTLTAQRRTTTGSKVLRRLKWTVRSGASVETREITRAELEPLLAAEFGLRLPAGTRFRSLDAV